MHAMIVSRGFPTSQYPLNGIFEYDQAKALKEVGCDVTLVAIDFRSVRRWRQWGLVQKTVDSIDVFIINVPIGRIPMTIKNRLAISILKGLFNRVVKLKGKPNIIHAHFFDIGYRTVKSLGAHHIPIVVTEHSSQINKDVVPSIIFNMANYTYKKADRIISVSQNFQSVIMNKFNIESTYIPNIVDLEVFKYLGKSSHETYGFVTVANLIPNKRIDLVIKSFGKIFSRYRDVSLTVFGEGREYKCLKKMIEEIELDGHVHLRGQQSRMEIAETFAKSDCFVLPSTSETFGVAYIEALAMGLPVIATRCGGPEGFIDASNGLLIPIDDQEALTEAMEHMYHHSKKFDNEKVAYDIRNKFSKQVVGKAILDTYENLLAKQEI